MATRLQRGGRGLCPGAVRGEASADRQAHLLPIWGDSIDRGELIVLHDQLHQGVEGPTCVCCRHGCAMGPGTTYQPEASLAIRDVTRLRRVDVEEVIF